MSTSVTVTSAKVVTSKVVTAKPAPAPAKVKVVQAPAKAPLITNKAKLAFNSELKKEVRTIGHCLSVLEKCKVAGADAIAIRKAAKEARTPERYKLLSAGVKPSKSGNFSVWSVLGWLIKNS
jgi:hypothetical protein